MSKLKVLDLFSGIGGFSLGLERTGGFETTCFCEIDEHAKKVLRKHWPDVPVISDVRNFLARNGEYDVICGGFPCQDISIGGRQKGIKNGTRSGLWFEFKRLISEIKPRYAIIENVAAIRNNGLECVLQDLYEIGYDCEWHCITARAVGHLHQRDRMWIIAYPRGQRQHECARQERYVSIDEEREIEEAYKIRKQCLTELIKVRTLLSRGALSNFRNSYSSTGAAVSELRRVLNGVPEGLDERRRKQRIKQLGNAVVPQIPQLIGEAILEYERRI